VARSIEGMDKAGLVKEDSLL